MIGVSRRIGLVALGAMLMLESGAQAAAPCWQDGEVAAARVRQMQTMLMVATLRCHAVQLDISADYNGFVTAQARAIAAANLVIKQHFATGGGSQADYDHFATALANGYGDDETGQGSCAEAAALARDGVAAGGEPGALDRIAAARLFPAALPGGTCSVPGEATPAAAGPTAAASPVTASLPPILALAAPALAAPTAQPVTLPADVLAALAVMARFHDGQLAAPAPAAGAATQMAAIGK